jgi:hypothetical protein
MNFLLWFIIPAVLFLSALGMVWKNSDCGICIFFGFILAAAGLLSLIFVLIFFSFMYHY